MAAIHAHRRMPSSYLPALAVLETNLVNASQSFNVPNLAGLSVATVKVLVKKTSSATSLQMLVGLLSSSGSSYTDLCYQASTGIGQNTYGAGFWCATDKMLLDGEAVVLLTAVFYANQQTSKFDLYVGDNMVPLSPASAPTGQVNRPFSSTIIFGATVGYQFQGTIYQWSALYAGQLTPAQHHFANQTILARNGLS